MFITTPMFEFKTPRGLGPPGSRYWRATSLTLHTPWYVVWWQPEPRGLSETILVAEEETLEALVRQMLPDQCTSLRVVSTHARSPTWQMRTVTELWHPLDDERSIAGPLLMRIAGQRELFGRYMQQVADRPGRQLLLKPIDQT